MNNEIRYNVTVKWDDKTTHHENVLANGPLYYTNPVEWKTDGKERARVGVDTGYIGRVDEPPIYEPNTITFNNTNSDWVMQITADRKIIVNEDVEVSEAAKVVLELVQKLLDKAQDK